MSKLGSTILAIAIAYSANAISADTSDADYSAPAPPTDSAQHLKDRGTDSPDTTKGTNNPAAEIKSKSEADQYTAPAPPTDSAQHLEDRGAVSKDPKGTTKTPAAKQ